MASLDTVDADDTAIQVMVKRDKINYLICTLSKNKEWQVPLNLDFEKGSEITFLTNGTSRVHLTGYDLEDHSEEAEEEYDSSEAEEQVVEREVPVEKGRKRKAELLKDGKKVKLAKQELINGGDDQDDEDSNYQFPEEDSDDDEVEETDDDDDDDDYSEEDKEQERLAKSQKQNRKMETQKKQKNKQDDKRIKMNVEEKLELLSKKQKKKVEQENNQKSTNKRTIDGGVQIEDLVFGNGPIATAGKYLTIYYVGRTKVGNQDKKIVDSCVSGKGFKFCLFKGNMIRGLSAGLVGMRPGGKRRITIPPAMGYGAKGFPPSIPSNATLEYEIDLKKVK